MHSRVLNSTRTTPLGVRGTIAAFSIACVCVPCLAAPVLAQTRAAPSTSKAKAPSASADLTQCNNLASTQDERLWISSSIPCAESFFKTKILALEAKPQPLSQDDNKALINYRQQLAAVESAASGSGTDILSQVSLEDAVSGSTGNSAQAKLDALDLFLSPDVRFYVRSTLPVSTSASTSATDVATTLGTAAAVAVQDPSGGVVNLSFGYFRQLVAPKWPAVIVDPADNRTPLLDPNSNRPLEGIDNSHGLFFDARLGLKLINLPGLPTTSSTALGSAVTPFYVGSASLKFIHNLYQAGVVGAPVSGGVEIGAGVVVTGALDTSSSPVFSNGALQRTTKDVFVEFAVNLPGVVAITVTGSPWTSNSTLGKNFLVGVTLASPSPSVGTSGKTGGG